jgi:hypothetical protein
VSESFSQQFCMIAPMTFLGTYRGTRIRSCLVEVTDGMLTIVAAPDRVLYHRPVEGLEIAAPPILAKIGTGVALRLDGQLVSVNFDTVFAGRKANAARSRGILARVLFYAGYFCGVYGFGGIRVGRRLTRELTAALLAEGATRQRTWVPSDYSPPSAKAPGGSP